MDNIRVALCVGSCQDNNLIREYCEYYISIGVDTIFVYDNNMPDGENPKDVLQGLEDHVVVIDKRGDRSRNRQPTFYTECYNQNKDKYDWICFFDNDEFLFLNVHKNIKEYLGNPAFASVDCVHVNWKMYGDNGHIHPVPGLSTFEQFPNPAPFDAHTLYKVCQNDHIKTIIHCLGKEIYFDHPHFCRSHTDTLRAVNEYGKPIRNDWPWTPFSYSLVELRHYQLRSTEEFCFKRLGGRGFQRFDGSIVNIRDEIKWYFAYNEYTDEKMAFINDWLSKHSG